MVKTVRLSLVLALAAAVLSTGCLPSQPEIESDMEASRQAAYMEWKRRRDRGESADTKLDGPLSTDDAIKIALQNNKSLQAMVQNREIARGDMIAAWEIALPTVTVNANASRQENRGLRTGGSLQSYSTNITVTQPVFDGGRIPATLRTARFLQALTDEEIRNSVEQLISTVATNYYDVLLAQKLLETNREAVISAEAQLRVVTEKRRQETATDYDVLRAQVDVANYRADMISQQNAIDTNRVALLKNMGVSQDSNITFSDQLEFLPMRPVFERAVQIAAGMRPDLRMAELDIRIKDEAVQIAKSGYWPVVSAFFSQGWSDPNSVYQTNSWQRNNWTAGAQAQWDLFNVGTYGNVVSRKAEATQSRLDLMDKQETALQEIRQNMNTLANAEEVVKALEVNQEAAREALRLVEVGYQAGVKTEVDVTDARKALTDVMGNYYSALASHTKARLGLQLAMGVLGPRRASEGIPKASPVPVANIEEFAASASDFKPEPGYLQNPTAPAAPAPVPTPAPAPAPVKQSNASQPQTYNRPVRSSDFKEPEVGMAPPAETQSPRLTPLPSSAPDRSMPGKAARDVIARPVEASAPPPMPPVEAMAARNDVPLPAVASAPVATPAAPAAVESAPARPMFKITVSGGSAATDRSGALSADIVDMAEAK